MSELSTRRRMVATMEIVQRRAAEVEAQGGQLTQVRQSGEAGWMGALTETGSSANQHG